MGAVYDLAVIGGGAAGLTAARFGVALGATVALVERGPAALGGECLHTGCVPSKALIHAARAHWAAGRTARFGLPGREAAGPVDLGAVMDGVQAVIRRAGEPDSPAALAARGVALHFGHATFRSPALLEVDGAPLRARRYILATGSRPAVPDIAGLDQVAYYTNETIVGLRALPAALVVVGGGPVGCELGQAFSRLGARVTLLQRAPRLLPREDPEASDLLRRALAREGVAVVTGATVRRVRRDGDELVATVARAGEEADYRGDALLVAAGRRVDASGLRLDAAGIAVGRGGIAVDRHGRTANPRVYACGDATGPLRFTHAAGYQAALVVRNALLPFPRPLDYRAIPWATFTAPEVARVGLTVEEARRARGGVRVTRLPYDQIDRALAARAEEGFIKLVHDGRGRLLGAQLVGPDAGETVSEVALAMKHGLGLGDLAAAVHVYPTLG
ncbi:MAG TPA: FAD-dependent oxidoreductase, partial [Thermomicrobiales bacterium]|nr:FAD-dependent oxidoreductase [Thermomicrobiales bacterium]